MPLIAHYKYLWFYIVSYDLNERFHLHISNTKSRKGKDAKIWLDNLEVFEKGGLSAKEINLCIKLLKANKEQLIDSINNFAKGNKQKSFELKFK